MSTTAIEEQPTKILTELRGQSIILPDLNAILGSWPREVHQDLGRLRCDVNEWLDSTMSHHRKLESFKAADFAYLGATWWPRARYERLRIVTFLATWVFVWDDDIDTDDGALWDKSQLCDSHREETRDYIRACLGLESRQIREDTVQSVNASIRAFETVGTALRQAYNYEQRKRFMGHMEHYLDMVGQEQMIRQRETLPSLEEFLSYRSGSSAVHVITAANEFAWANESLANSVMDNDNMKLLWDHTNNIISTVNDIVSLKKEMAGGSAHSMIPVLYVRSGDAQVAVNQTAEFLSANVKAFEKTAQRLLEQEKWRHFEEVFRICDFIKGCQFYCTGNVSWSLATRRYGINDGDLASGVRITL